MMYKLLNAIVILVSLAVIVFGIMGLFEFFENYIFNSVSMILSAIMVLLVLGSFYLTRKATLATDEALKKTDAMLELTKSSLDIIKKDFDYRYGPLDVQVIEYDFESFKGSSESTLALRYQNSSSLQNKVLVITVWSSRNKKHLIPFFVKSNKEAIVEPTDIKWVTYKSRISCEHLLNDTSSIEFRDMNGNRYSYNALFTELHGSYNVFRTKKKGDMMKRNEKMMFIRI
jgi:hypothetical protein